MKKKEVEEERGRYGKTGGGKERERCKIEVEERGRRGKFWDEMERDRKKR